MPTNEMPKLIRCPKCPDAEMLLMPWWYILQRAELADGKPTITPDDQPGARALLKFYSCGMCGYSEFYLPKSYSAHLIEVPPEFLP